MAMADGHSGLQGNCSSKAPVFKQKRDLIQQHLDENERIHKNVFQENSNLGKREDAPIFTETRLYKPTKRMVTNKVSLKSTRQANNATSLESVSRRKSVAIAEVSTQVSLQTAFELRMPGVAILTQATQYNKLDYREEIFSHLLATDVSHASFRNRLLKV
jgi:hypothetical protein